MRKKSNSLLLVIDAYNYSLNYYRDYLASFAFFSRHTERSSEKRLEQDRKCWSKTVFGQRLRNGVKIISAYYIAQRYTRN